MRSCHTSVGCQKQIVKTLTAENISIARSKLFKTLIKKISLPPEEKNCFKHNAEKLSFETYEFPSRYRLFSFVSPVKDNQSMESRLFSLRSRASRLTSCWSMGGVNEVDVVSTQSEYLHLVKMTSSIELEASLMIWNPTVSPEMQKEGVTF